MIYTVELTEQEEQQNEKSKEEKIPTAMKSK
jgi:hypothetical protein